VAAHGGALLILGPSGAGKSSLALQMMALGAQLVSDDQTEVFSAQSGLMARCPAAAIHGLIEARGVGLLRTNPVDQAPVTLVADLSQLEDQRLPPRRQITILHSDLPLVLRALGPHFAAALMLYLQHGRQD
jgi:HPr kinase/phosphorylase